MKPQLPVTMVVTPCHEVQEALWVRVSELLHPDAAIEYLHDLADGGTLSFPAYDARGQVVWGMTHRILAGFLIGRLLAPRR